MYRHAATRAIAIATALFSLMAFSDAKVSTRNAESLDASLQSILQPLSQTERMEFMGAFFDYAYFEDCKSKIGQPIHSSKDYSLKYCRERIDGSRDLAMNYIGDRRMDGKTEYVTSSLLMGTQHHGHSAAMSYTLFIDRFGSYLDGKSANHILSAMRSEGAIGDQTLRADTVAELTVQLARLEGELAQWEENLPKISRLGSRLGTGGQAEKYMSQCQNAIDHRRKVIARKRAIVEHNDYSIDPGTSIGTGGARCMRVNGVRGEGWIDLSALPATTRVTAVEKDSARNDLYLGALNAIQITSLREFKTKQHRSGLAMSFKPTVQFESPRDKAVKRVEYGMAVIPRSDHFAMVSVKGRALNLTRTGGNNYRAAERLSNKTLSRGYEAFVGASQDDFHILPYIRQIEYEDGTKDYIVENDDDMLHFLINIEDADMK